MIHSWYCWEFLYILIKCVIIRTTYNFLFFFFYEIQVSQTTSKLNIDDYDVDEDEDDVENIQSNKNGESNDELEERYNK